MQTIFFGLLTALAILQMPTCSFAGFHHQAPIFQQAPIYQPQPVPAPVQPVKAAPVACNPQCQNGGNCVNGVCICPAGFVGTACEAESAGLCSDTFSYEEKPILSISFGAGPDQYSSATPADFNFTTTYTRRSSSPIHDGEYTFINSVPSDYPSSWYTGMLDHTGDKGGYMYLLTPVGGTPTQIYNGAVSDLIIGRRYELSVYVANIMVNGGILPNILFEIRNPSLQNSLIAQLSSGNIPTNTKWTWIKYGLSFVAPSTTISLLMISTAVSGNGNDFVIDDVTLRVCKAGAGLIDPKDKCLTNNGGCPVNTICSSQPGQNDVICTCKKGYTNTGNTPSLVCTDACQVNNGGCPQNADCSHNSKTYAVQCTCKTGYTASGSGSSLVCTGTRLDHLRRCRKRPVCSSDAAGGARSCTCRAGFTNTGAASNVVCTDNCQINNGGCGGNAICYRDDEDYALKCKCKPGYVDDGTPGQINCVG